MPLCNRRLSNDSVASDASLAFDCLAALTALGESIPLADELQSYEHAGSTVDTKSATSQVGRTSDAGSGSAANATASHTTPGQHWARDANSHFGHAANGLTQQQMHEQAMHMHAAAWAYGAVPNPAFQFHTRADLNANASIFVPRF